MRHSVLAGALLIATAALVPAASAQEAHSWMFGGYARVSLLDPKYDAGQGGGIGARAGYFLDENWEAQVDLSYSQNKIDTAGSVKSLPVHLRILYNWPPNDSWALFLGAGYTYWNTSGSLTGSSNGWGVIGGFRIRFTDSWGTFLDYTGDRIYKPYSPAWNSGLEFGVSWRPAKEKPAPAPPPPPPPPAAAPAAAAAVVAAPADDDHDGVVNDSDKCPNTPSGETADANGCSASQRDTDGDGVTDDKDKCPDTPHGTVVDANGCPLPPLVLKGVNFETNKAVLLPGSASVLDTVASSLLVHKNIQVEIDGYSDNSGTEQHNLQLSQARADAVKAYLVSRGVPAERLTARGFGEANPLVPNTSAANKAQNRRVELKESTN